MTGPRAHPNEAQKNTEPAQQPRQEPARQNEQGPMQAVAPQVAYRRAQSDRNALMPADLLAVQRTAGNRMVQQMMAHEWTRLVQQDANRGRNSSSAIQRENGRQSSPLLFPSFQDFEAQVFPTGGVLSFRSRRRVILQTAPEARTSRAPFAYQYLPAMPTLRRSWPIIRLVVAPGVSIRLEGYPSTYVGSDDLPIVEIYRVQDPELVPAQGESINPSKAIRSTGQSYERWNCRRHCQSKSLQYLKRKCRRDLVWNLTGRCLGADEARPSQCSTDIRNPSASCTGGWQRLRGTAIYRQYCSHAA